jgi:hypothetical protein
MVVTQWHGDNGLVRYFSPTARRELTVTRWAFVQNFFKGWWVD